MRVTYVFLRETMNLLFEVLAVANGTLYSLRSVESAFREEAIVKERNFCLYSSFVR